MPAWSEMALLIRSVDDHPSWTPTLCPTAAAPAVLAPLHVVHAIGSEFQHQTLAASAYTSRPWPVNRRATALRHSTHPLMLVIWQAQCQCSHFTAPSKKRFDPPPASPQTATRRQPHHADFASRCGLLPLPLQVQSNGCHLRPASWVVIRNKPESIGTLPKRCSINLHALKMKAVISQPTLHGPTRPPTQRITPVSFFFPQNKKGPEGPW